MLNACHVGNISDLPVEEYFRRMREDIYIVLEDEEEDKSDIPDHYRRQLFRWIANIPENLKRFQNKQQTTNIDPNTQPFPLPDDIKRNVETLRDWPCSTDAKRREDGWNDDVTVERADDYSDDSSDDSDYEVHSFATCGKSKKINDPHEFFVEICASHVDKNAAPFDTSIDGAVAWLEIELDLVKTDQATDDQQAIWAERAKRKPMSEKARKARRATLYDYLKSKYWGISLTQNSFDCMTDSLADSWKVFQSLCKK